MDTYAHTYIYIKLSRQQTQGSNSYTLPRYTVSSDRFYFISRVPISYILIKASHEPYFFLYMKS